MEYVGIYKAFVTNIIAPCRIFYMREMSFVEYSCADFSQDSGEVNILCKHFANILSMDKRMYFYQCFC